MNTTTARNVAGYILDHLGPMYAWKLQKLTYYAQAWALAWEGHPLFSDRIEAWKNGPVTKSVWNAHRGKYKVSNLPGARPEDLTPEQAEIVNAVMAFYGGYDGDALSRMTHDEGPWREARGGLPDGAVSEAEISQRSMRNFYAQAVFRGDKVPTRHSSVKVVDSSRTAALADAEIERWRHTLDWLAVR